MDSNAIETKIREILKSNATIMVSIGKDVDAININDDFMEDLGLDSISILTLITEIEKGFSIKIGQGEMSRENLGSIASSINYIQGKLNT